MCISVTLQCRPRCLQRGNLRVVSALLGMFTTLCLPHVTFYWIMWINFVGQSITGVFLCLSLMLFVNWSWFFPLPFICVIFKAVNSRVLLFVCPWWAKAFSNLTVCLSTLQFKLLDDSSQRSAFVSQNKKDVGLDFYYFITLDLCKHKCSMSLTLKAIKSLYAPNCLEG